MPTSIEMRTTIGWCTAFESTPFHSLQHAIHIDVDINLINSISGMEAHIHREIERKSHSERGRT